MTRFVRRAHSGWRMTQVLSSESQIEAGFVRERGKPSYPGSARVNGETSLESPRHPRAIHSVQAAEKQLSLAVVQSGIVTCVRLGAERTYHCLDGEHDESRTSLGDVLDRRSSKRKSTVSAEAVVGPLFPATGATGRPVRCPRASNALSTKRRCRCRLSVSRSANSAVPANRRPRQPLVAAGCYHGESTSTARCNCAERGGGLVVARSRPWNRPITQTTVRQSTRSSDVIRLRNLPCRSTSSLSVFSTAGG